MKLYILSGAILLLMAGVTLAGNSLEVTGQSDLEEAQDILNTAANTTANATGELMSRADNVLSLASDAASNATRTAMDKTLKILSNVSNNVTDAGLNTSSNLTEPIIATQEVLKKYENGKYGISFQYPSEWGEPSDFGCEYPSRLTCGPFFIITSDKTKEGFTFYLPGVSVFDLHKPAGIDKACDCNTLKDFVAWYYVRGDNENRTFINDNQTIIGKNYSAWQTETDYTSGDHRTKYLRLYAVNGNIGYVFSYSGPSDKEFDRHIDGFVNMLKSVTLTSPVPEKKPSFLDYEIANSTSTAKEKSVKILSSNDFIDSIGYLHVVGEIENDTPTSIRFVKVTGTFYDSNNEVVATDFTYTNPTDIGSGQKAPFELILTSASVPISQIDHYELKGSYQ